MGSPPWRSPRAVQTWAWPAAAEGLAGAAPDGSPSAPEAGLCFYDCPANAFQKFSRGITVSGFGLIDVKV